MGRRLRKCCSDKNRLLQNPVIGPDAAMPRELVPASARVSPDHTHPEEGLRHTTRGIPPTASLAERMYDDNCIVTNSTGRVNRNTGSGMPDFS